MGIFSPEMGNLQYNMYCIFFFFYHFTDCSFRNVYCLLTAVLKHFIMSGFSMFLLGNLDYSDDTAMARCVVQSILTRAGFDERDMAHRYTNELAHCCKLKPEF